MPDINRLPDNIKIYTENDKITDAAVRFEQNGNELKVFLTAKNDKVKFIRLYWKTPSPEGAKVLGDKWERSYADLEWLNPDPLKYMPWYFLCNYGENTDCMGVKVRPASFVCFTCDRQGVTAWLDVRNGSGGVELDGRELTAAVIVCKNYKGISAFEAQKDFCKALCDDPILPSEPVYGSNNWYYAYGKSTREEILRDASLLAELTEGLENRPFMVIDDGWTINSCCGPWLPKDEYGDMKTLADEFKAKGVRPGIWVRLLNDEDLYKVHPEWYLPEKNGEYYIDPTNPEAKEHIREDLRRIRSWGYELLKHDFSSADLFGKWGSQMNEQVNHYDNWHFYDRTKTSAEIVVDFYKLIREETEGMYIIGCNTFGHLAAGLEEMQRIGDDTSGREWSRTRSYGVNTLAFRLAQNDAFYKVDADCVGILGTNIPWKLNGQWLDLLAKSGSPLFVSCQPEAATEEIKADLKKAFAISSVQKDKAEPLDWFVARCPERWSINGEEIQYDWYEGYIKEEL